VRRVGQAEVIGAVDTVSVSRRCKVMWFTAMTKAGPSLYRFSRNCQLFVYFSGRFCSEVRTGRMKIAQSVYFIYTLVETLPFTVPLPSFHELDAWYKFYKELAHRIS
jgi:hypothetical protein